MPENVVISVGKGNGYGHPSDKTLDYLKGNGKWKPETYRTDFDGDIIFRYSDDKGKLVYEAK